jgi:pilus assembly protein CpaF
LDIIVQLDRQNDGTRVVSSIAEVQGREGETITLQEIFLRATNGSLRATGLRPRCSERLAARGVDLPSAVFRATPVAAASRKGR